MILKFAKGSDVKLSPHFIVSEFDCKCENTSCTTQIDEDLISKLEALRTELNQPLKITSGYRCAIYQTELRLKGYETAVGISQHQLGRAADVAGEDHELSGGTLETAARKVGFMAVGVGNYWVHVDLRDDAERRWTYKSS